MKTSPSVDGAPISWRVVAMLSVWETVAWGVLYYAFGALLRPFAEHLAVSEALVAGAFSVALLTAGLASWAAGKSIDRWGPRAVMVVGAVLAVCAFASLGAVHSIGAFYVVWALIGLSHAAVLYEPAFAAIAKWFPSATQRARAFLALTTVAGFASTIFVPVTAMLLDHFGRQRATLALAGLLGVIVLPLNAALPRGRGVPTARAPEYPPALPPGTTRARSPRLATLAVVFSLQAFASAGVTVHLVSFLRETGLELSTAAKIAGLMGAAQVPARLLFGFFHRVIGPRARLPLLLTTQAVALVVVLGRGPMIAAAAVLLLGAANGLVTLERATVIADSFGPHEVGATGGRIATFVLATRAGAPIAVGLLREGWSYGSAFVVLAVLTAAGAALMWFAHDGRRTPPAQGGA